MKKLLTMLLSFVFFQASAQEPIPLYGSVKPNSKGQKLSDSIANERVYQVGEPRIIPFLVSKEENSGSSVLIIPGGGYSRLAYIVSGTQLAKWFNTMGINAFVLIHRLPHSPDVINRSLAPLQDAQRAIRLIRAKAADWHLDPSRVGVMGSSAGGHLAASLASIEQPIQALGDGIDQFSSKPNFSILVSPVITMEGEFAHRGSVENLLGDEEPFKKELFSLQKQVTEKTAPTFLVHAQNDKTVPVQNSLLYYEALQAHHIPASLHIFPQGGHAIAVVNNPGSTAIWPRICEVWLQEIQMIKP
ncbi:alpha/beta hydrolase [Sphingobacterium sp. N143]|uniref:alpha/beta hydrolase n=1 Tax=Sphingobacterium sp. N143 TaxID=2746727 RepID=UPI00257608B8|nr:alpha/beta hydrolase [Sphingobacterium sp. N143]MDM1292711.1 alpha/beta hydrolase [Sphingobacterium sp. N143]